MKGLLCVSLGQRATAAVLPRCDRLQAGEPQNLTAELALGGQRSTGEGRQVDRANLLVTVAAGMFWQIQSDIYIYIYI